MLKNFFLLIVCVLIAYRFFKRFHSSESILLGKETEAFIFPALLYHTEHIVNIIHCTNNMM